VIRIIVPVGIEQGRAVRIIKPTIRRVTVCYRFSEKPLFGATPRRRRLTNPDNGNVRKGKWTATLVLPLIVFAI
jgi:hypothetical protein